MHFFHSKLVALMRPYLFLKREKDEHGKKKKKQYSAARRAMVKGFILLKLEPKQPETQAAEHSTDGVPMQPEVLPFDFKFVFWIGWHQLAIDLAPPPLEIQPDKRNFRRTSRHSLVSHRICQLQDHAFSLVCR